MNKQVLLSVLVFLAFVGAGIGYRMAIASDHDDGENLTKNRNLNLTDHLAWKDTTDATKLNLAQYSNPRSLPGYQYDFATSTRYEFHVTRVADKTAVPTGSDDMIFRFEFGARATDGTQSIVFTVVKDGTVVGTHTGTTTTFAKSKANTVTTNTATIGGQVYRYFAGAREDTFFFDVVRFFQVRAFIADRILGGNTSAALAADCAGGALPFNPASCAPDFTKNYNVNAIVLQAPIAAMQSAGQTTFDTWSTISVGQ